MLAIITKASNDYWYKLKEVNTIKELFDIYHSVIVEKNGYEDWKDCEFLTFFGDNIIKEDIPLIKKAECHIIIYDSYVE